MWGWWLLCCPTNTIALLFLSQVLPSCHKFAETNLKGEKIFKFCLQFHTISWPSRRLGKLYIWPTNHCLSSTDKTTVLYLAKDIQWILSMAKYLASTFSVNKRYLCISFHCTTQKSVENISLIPLFHFPSVQCAMEYLNGLIWLPTYFLANLLWAHNGLALTWEFIATKKENLDWITCQLAKLPQFISFEQIGKKHALKCLLRTGIWTSI